MNGRLAVVALVIAFALAGCADKGGKDDADDPSSTGNGASPGDSGTASGSTSATGTSSGSTGTGPANTPPSIRSFTGNSTGLDAAFAFNATDAESSSVTYALAFGDGTANVTGTVAGVGNATHAYAAAGMYNATLTVSDGSLSTNQTIKIEVTATGAGGGAQHESGDFVAANVCQGFFLGDLDGITQLHFEVDPATVGLPYQAVVDGDGVAGIRLGFFDAAGANVGGASFAPGVTTASGTVPDDALEATLVGCGGGPYTAVYDAGAV